MSGDPQFPIGDRLVGYDIAVRPTVMGRLILPADLTEAEAERVCAIVRSVAWRNDAVTAPASTPSPAPSDQAGAS